MYIPTTVLTQGTGVTVYDNILGADAASIDTGAIIPGAYSVLEVLMLLRTTESADISGVTMTINGDGGANYDRQRVMGSSATASAAVNNASTSIPFSACGATQQAGAVTQVQLVFFGYASTTFHKVGAATVATPDDTNTNNRIEVQTVRWRNTAAITQLAIAAQANNILAGSRLQVRVR